jgi:hypothetical protein
MLPEEKELYLFLVLVTVFSRWYYNCPSPRRNTDNSLGEKLK